MKTILQHKQLATPLGEMLAVTSEQFLCFLAFIDQLNIDRSLQKLQQHLNGQLVKGDNAILGQIQQELDGYFQGHLKYFSTPVLFHGTPFQTTVWQSLQSIPYGHSRSYKTLAESIHHPKAVRAVANANAANLLTIIVPCHRVIQADQSLGGYAGGMSRKQYLLELEGAL